MAKTKANTRARKTPAKRTRRLRTRDLPGMEDRAIQPLQDVAFEYAAIRDDRMALNVRELDLKQRVRRLMHEYGKTHYAYDGVDIELIPPDGEEDVKVKVKKDAPVEEAASA